MTFNLGMKIWDLNLGALPDSWETFVTYTWKQWHFEHEAHVPKYDKEEGWRIKAKKETQVGINGNDTNNKILEIQLLKAKVWNVSKIIEAKPTTKAMNNQCLHNHM